MDRQQDSDEDAKSVDRPEGGAAPDEGLAYDPEMTDQDEANIPAGSDADPESKD